MARDPAPGKGGRRFADSSPPWRSMSVTRSTGPGSFYGTFSGALEHFDPRTREPKRRPTTADPSGRSVSRPRDFQTSPAVNGFAAGNTMRRTILPSELFGGDELFVTETGTRPRPRVRAPPPILSGSASHIHSQNDQEIYEDPTRPSLERTQTLRQREVQERHDRIQDHQQSADGVFYPSHAGRPGTIAPFPEHQPDPYGGDPKKLARLRSRPQSEQPPFHTPTATKALWFRSIACNIH